MMLLQNFAFPPDVIKYIMATNDPDIVMKLYKTCKYFHFKINLLLVGGIHITSPRDELLYNDETIYVNQKAVNSFKNLWVTDKVTCGFKRARLSTWISNISRCTISSLCIRENNLMFNEFKILTESGSVEDIYISKVFYEDQSEVPLEVLLSYVPEATSIGCEYTHVTPTSMKIISEVMKNPKKITYFILSNIDSMLDDEEYYQFMTKYAAQDAAFYVEFAGNISKEDAKKFGSSVKFKNFMSKDPNPKPYFSYSL